MRLYSLRVMAVMVGLCLLVHHALSDPDPHHGHGHHGHRRGGGWDGNGGGWDGYGGANAAGGAGGSSQNVLQNDIVVKPVIVLQDGTAIPGQVVAEVPAE
nr:uncharacterized protein LOC128704911 [Cherax quadricarinatus]